MSVIAVVVLIVFLYLGRRRLLGFVGHFLIKVNVVDDYDAIVLMNGNISTRPFRAAELYKKRAAPILLAKLADTEEVRMDVIPNISIASKDLLVKLGVPEKHVQLLESDRWVAGTWGEAIMLCSYIRKQNYRNILIVTDAFHTRRAHWVFRKVMDNKDYTFNCAATSFTQDAAKKWWQSEYGLVQLVVEYLKFLHYQRMVATGKFSPLEADLPLADEVRPLIIGKLSGK